MRVDNGAIEVATPSLGLQVDVVQDYRNRRDVGSAQCIQRELDDLLSERGPAFG